MSQSDTNTAAAVDRLAQTVSGTGYPSQSDLCDWSKGHTLTLVDWPVLLLNDAFIIAGVSLVVWILLRKRR